MKVLLSIIKLLLLLFVVLPKMMSERCWFRIPPCTGVEFFCWMSRYSKQISIFLGLPGNIPNILKTLQLFIAIIIIIIIIIIIVVVVITIILIHLVVRCLLTACSG